MRLRRPVTLLVILAVLVGPASALAASTTPLKTQPPPWVSTSTTSTSTPVSTTTPQTATIAAATTPSSLPRTGSDLGVEALIGFALLTAGVAVRFRRPA